MGSIDDLGYRGMRRNIAEIREVPKAAQKKNTNSSRSVSKEERSTSRHTHVPVSTGGRICQAKEEVSNDQTNRPANEKDWGGLRGPEEATVKKKRK